MMTDVNLMQHWSGNLRKDKNEEIILKKQSQDVRKEYIAAISLFEQFHSPVVGPQLTWQSMSI